MKGMRRSEKPIWMADRVVVMHQGRQSGELLRQAVTVDRMMTLAFGGQS